MITIRLLRKRKTGQGVVYTLPPYRSKGAYALFQNVLGRGYPAFLAERDVGVAVTTEFLADIWEFRGAAADMQPLFALGMARFAEARRATRNPA